MKFSVERLGVVLKALRHDAGRDGDAISVRNFNVNEFSLSNYDMVILLVWWSAYGRVNNLATINNDELDAIAQTMDGYKAFYEPYFKALARANVGLDKVVPFLSHKPRAVDFDNISRNANCFKDFRNPKAWGLNDIGGVLALNYGLNYDYNLSRLSMAAFGLSVLGLGLSILTGSSLGMSVFGLCIAISSCVFLYSNRPLTITVIGGSNEGADISVNR